MSRPRHIANATRFEFLVNRELLDKFKQYSTGDITSPSDVLRTMISRYIDVKECSVIKARTRFEMIHGILDQVNILIDDNGIFRLNDLVAIDTRAFVKEVRQFNAAYIQCTNVNTYILALPEGEHVRLSYGNGECVMTSTVHSIRIYVKGFYIYVTMPLEYRQSDDTQLKHRYIDSLLVTLAGLKSKYREQMLSLLATEPNTFVT